MSESHGSPMPQLEALAQYVKDLSFENPHAPRSLAPQAASPEIAVNVNVGFKNIDENDYEVELLFEGQAGGDENIIFKFDLRFCGIFRLLNIPKEHESQVLMIECPRLLFPFARSILANAVRDGGFPPFLIHPIDFAQLYQNRVAEAMKMNS